MTENEIIKWVAAEAKDRDNISTVLQISRIRRMLAEEGYGPPEEPTVGHFDFGFDTVQSLEQSEDGFLVFCEHSIWRLYINTGTGLLEQTLVRYL